MQAPLRKMVQISLAYSEMVDVLGRWVKGRSVEPVATFLRFDFWAALASLLGVVLFSALVLGNGELTGVAITLALLVVALFVARRQLSKGNLAASLLLVLGANWLTAYVITTTVGFLWPTMMITTVMPALLVLPYVEGRGTLILASSTVGMTLGVVAIGLNSDDNPLELDAWFQNLVVLITLALVGAACGLIAWSTGEVQEGELTEIKELNHSLNLVQDQLTASRRRVVEASDIERQRIERDLHDGAQQRLVALGVGLRLLRHQHEDQPELVASIDGFLSETEAAVEELRELSRGIYPPLLRSQGLVSALRSVARRSPSEVSVTVRGEQRSPFVAGSERAVVEPALYFVATEALTNAAKHAPESAVTVTIEWHKTSLVLMVQDDGPGLGDEVQSDSQGMANMADRVAALDGELTVESPPGGGTTVRAEVPLVAHVAD